MPLAPVWKLKHKEIVWLARHRCRHYHTYLEHYQCYLKENPLKEKIGFFDIETSNLQADFGIIYCYCLKEYGKNKIYERLITKQELNSCLDKKVVEQCIKDLSRFDRIVGFYSSRFDNGFVRTRAVALNIPFPEYGELIHNDIYYIVRNKFRIHRNRLEDACRVLVGKTRKTHLDAHHWIKGLQGNKESLTYILEHCRGDVRDLEDLYNKIINYSKKQDKSI